MSRTDAQKLVLAPIKEQVFHLRVIGVLTRNEVKLVGDLLWMSREDLEALHGMGPELLRQIDWWLSGREDPLIWYLTDTPSMTTGRRLSWFPPKFVMKQFAWEREALGGQFPLQVGRPLDALEPGLGEFFLAHREEAIKKAYQKFPR
jgi:hypothetical protein